MIAFLTAFLIGAPLAAPSAQKAFDVEKGEQRWDFSYRWKDAQNDVQRVSFSLPADALRADREEITWLPRKQMNQAVASDVRTWGKRQRGVDVKVKVAGGGVRTEVSGDRSKVKSVLREAETVRDEAVDAWLAENGFMRLGDALSFDHAAIVQEVASDLDPVAAALRAGTASDREFVERALSFVQAIPYEARKKQGGDPGYRRPLALLSRNRGDCDSKSVLFLALVRAELPRVPLSVVYVPNHALTGVGLPSRSGDRSFKADGVEYLYAEPVGPALFALGDPAKENRRAGKRGEVRAVSR